ncbi:MAG: hypothetical protein ABI670_14580 [Chloroflexota bacterium]
MLTILKERIPGGSKNKLIILSILFLLSILFSLFAASVYVVSNTPPEIPMFPGARLIEGKPYISSFLQERLVERKVMEMKGNWPTNREKYEGILTDAGWGSEVLYSCGSWEVTEGWAAQVRQKNKWMVVVQYLNSGDDNTNIEVALYTPLPASRRCTFH